jgi:uncharacterized protein YkwD
MRRLANNSAIAVLATASLAAAGCGGGGSGGSNAPVPPPAPTGGASVGVGDAQFVTNGGSGKQKATFAVPDVSKLKNLPHPSGVSAGPGVCPGSSTIPTGSNIGGVKASVLCLLNAQRTSRGLGPVKLNGKLAKAALAHSSDMVSRHYFAHDAPGGGNVVTRAKKAGYIPRIGLWTVGENLAFGSGSAASAADIMQAWMNSPPHRANILTKAFKEIGIGIVSGAPKGGGGATFTTVFGAIRRH